MRLSREACLQARALVATRLGLDFPDARLADLERGLVRALRRSAHASPEPYLAWLATVSDEDPALRRFAAELTVGETYFFRDRAAFEALERHVLPSLIASRRAQGIRRLRVWSAACATGEEPYSLAILLDRLLPDRAAWSVTILATDINPESLDAAQRGLYRTWSLRDTPASVRERYFRSAPEQAFELDPALRRLVTFAPLNLAADTYPSVVTNTGAMDLIMCRNVLMYFGRDAQRAAVARLQRALVTGGWLAVGPAEASFELLHPLAPVQFEDAILYRKGPAPAGVLAEPTWGAATLFGDAPAPLPPPWPESNAPSQRSPPPDLPVEVALPPDESQGTAEPDDGAAQASEPAKDVERARALADQGRLDDALGLCESALARDRLDPEPHLLLAAIRQERGDVAAALDALRGALYLAPDWAPAHFLQGCLLLRQGERRRARRSIEIAVALLGPVAPHEVLPGTGGLTAGRLRETARAYLEASR